MNRCSQPNHPKIPARRDLLSLALASFLLSLTGITAAQTNVRPFPANTMRGTMTVVAPPIIELNGKPDRLSPGARIHGMNNMLIMSGSVIGKPLLVNFLRNPTGEIHEVWVLTEAEAALKLPTQL
jgi:hypothetical protein